MLEEEESSKAFCPHPTVELYRGFINQMRNSVFLYL